MALQLPWAMNNPFAKADKQAAGMGEPSKPAKKESTTIQDNQQDNDPLTDKPKAKVGDDPMLNFESLWQPNKNEKGEVIQEESDTGSYMPKLDPKKLQAMVDKMDFTSGITEEEIAALKEGGDKSLGAFANMINRAGRKSFQTAFEASSRLAEQGFTKAQERFMKGIPAHVREMMVDNELEGSIPLMKNPAFRPQVLQVKSQFLKKYPKATPQQVNDGVTQYFAGLEAEFAKGKKSKEEANAPTAEKKLRIGDPTADFESWLGDEINQLGGKGMFQDQDENVDQTA